jgi:hypothetical protein
MEVWKIADSPFAPKFHVISQPNDWAKAVKKTSSQQFQVTDNGLLQLEFWEKFREFVQNKDSQIRLKKPQPQMFYDINFGNSQAQISLNVYSKQNQISCEVYIHNSKELFHALEARKNVIEQELNQKLVWLELPQRKASRIRVFESGNISNTEKWEDYFTWLLNNVKSFQRIFSKHISEINKPAYE